MTTYAQWEISQPPSQFIDCFAVPTLLLPALIGSAEWALGSIARARNDGSSPLCFGRGDQAYGFTVAPLLPRALSERVCWNPTTTTVALFATAPLQTVWELSDGSMKARTTFHNPSANPLPEMLRGGWWLSPPTVATVTLECRWESSRPDELITRASYERRPSINEKLDELLTPDGDKVRAFEALCRANRAFVGYLASQRPDPSGHRSFACRIRLGAAVSQLDEESQQLLESPDRPRTAPLPDSTILTLTLGLMARVRAPLREAVMRVASGGPLYVVGERTGALTVNCVTGGVTDGATIHYEYAPVPGAARSRLALLEFAKGLLARRRYGELWQLLRKREIGSLPLVGEPLTNLTSMNPSPFSLDRSTVITTLRAVASALNAMKPTLQQLQALASEQPPEQRVFALRPVS